MSVFFSCQETKGASDDTGNSLVDREIVMSTVSRVGRLAPYDIKAGCSLLVTIHLLALCLFGRFIR